MSFPKNLCLAPFIFNTIDPSGNQAPCPTLGGDLWNFNNIPMRDRWQSVELQDFRKRTLSNEKMPECNICWSREDAGGYSLRKSIYDTETDPDGTETKLHFTDITPETALQETFYKNGPMQLVMKVNNFCNLRCRSCNSTDSVLYKIEGEHYKEKYLLNEHYYTRGPDRNEWTDQQLDEIYEFTGNLKRLEFYGGEPLLDTQTPKLLKKLAESGRSKEIFLNISTNTTTLPDDDWVDSVSHFKSFNLNLSIDGLGDQFEYIRFPAKWSNVSKNINWFHTVLREKFASTNNYFSLLPSIAITSLNIYYLPELVEWLTQATDTDPHLNLATNPSYYNIKNLPDQVKSAVVEKFSKFNNPRLDRVLKFMETPADASAWEDFKFWTMAKDEYRQEDFKITFPEYYKVIRESGNWDEDVDTLVKKLQIKPRYYNYFALQTKK